MHCWLKSLKQRCLVPFLEGWFVLKFRKGWSQSCLFWAWWSIHFLRAKDLYKLIISSLRFLWISVLSCSKNYRVIGIGDYLWKLPYSLYTSLKWIMIKARPNILRWGTPVKPGWAWIWEHTFILNSPWSTNKIISEPFQCWSMDSTEWKFFQETSVTYSIESLWQINY